MFVAVVEGNIYLIKQFSEADYLLKIHIYAQILKVVKLRVKEGGLAVDNYAVKSDCISSSSY